MKMFILLMSLSLIFVPQPKVNHFDTSIVNLMDLPGSPTFTFQDTHSPAHIG